MDKIITLILAIVITGCASTSEFERVSSIPEDVTSVQAVIPIYSQKLVFQLPTDWKAAFQDQTANSYLIEFTPKVESIANWNNLISIQGFKDLASKTSAEKFLNDVAEGFKATCGEHRVYEKFGASKIDGYNSYTAILGCAEVPVTTSTEVQEGQSEIGYYLSIKGEKDIYLIHKSIRGDAFEVTTPPINRQNTMEFIKMMTPFVLCKEGDHRAICDIKPTAIANTNASCPSNITTFEVGSATSQFIKQCMGKPTYEDYNEDGRYVYLYSTQKDIVLTYLFGQDDKLIKVTGYERTKNE